MSTTVNDMFFLFFFLLLILNLFISSPSRIMALSRKLTAMDENISSDALFLGKVSVVSTL